MMMMMMSGRIVHALTIDDAANFRTDQRTDQRTDRQGNSRSRMIIVQLTRMSVPEPRPWYLSPNTGHPAFGVQAKVKDNQDNHSEFRQR